METRQIECGRCKTALPAPSHACYRAANLLLGSRFFSIPQYFGYPFGIDTVASAKKVIQITKILNMLRPAAPLSRQCSHN